MRLNWEEDVQHEGQSSPVLQHFRILQKNYFRILQQVKLSINKDILRHTKLQKTFLKILQKTSKA